MRVEVYLIPGELCRGLVAKAGRNGKGISEDQLSGRKPLKHEQYVTFGNFVGEEDVMYDYIFRVVFVD